MTSHRFSLSARAAVVAGAVTLAACSDDATSPNRTRLLPGNISAVDNPDLSRNVVVSPLVDGRIGRGEYTGAASFTFVAQIPSVFNVLKTPVTVYVTHDQTHLYLAATFDRKSAFHPSDVVGFEFDNDNDGDREDGDDIVFIRPSTPQNVAGTVSDFYRYNGGAANWWDTNDGGTLDGISAWGTIGTKGVFEIRHPLNSADDAHDVSINPWIFPQTVGLQTGVRLEGGAVGSNMAVTTHHPSFTTYCKLMISQSSTGVACP